jgi:hypothetical protein
MTAHNKLAAGYRLLRASIRNELWAKKSPLMKAGLKLFSWRRIVETGAIMGVAQIFV